MFHYKSQVYLSRGYSKVTCWQRLNIEWNCVCVNYSTWTIYMATCISYQRQFPNNNNNSNNNNNNNNISYLIERRYPALSVAQRRFTNGETWWNIYFKTTSHEGVTFGTVSEIGWEAVPKNNSLGAQKAKALSPWFLVLDGGWPRRCWQRNKQTGKHVHSCPNKRTTGTAYGRLSPTYWFKLNNSDSLPMVSNLKDVGLWILA